MLRPLAEINNCYKLQALLSTTPLAEEWAASAIFSPHRFILRFFKAASLSAQAMERFRHEAMRYYGLRLEGFAKLIEVEYYEGRLFACSEYYGDETLASRLAKPGGIDLTAACELAVAFGRSLAGLHANGLIYASLSPAAVRVGAGQLSPENAALEVPGSFTLLSDGDGPRQAKPAVSCFLAPEAHAGAKLGPACDIYSLGAMLAWLTTRVEPKAGQGGSAWLDAMRQKQLPEEIVAAVSMALADAAAQRQGSVNDFIQAIELWLDARRIKAPPPWSGDPIEPGLASVAQEARPPARLPEAVPHPEVIKYFQELSSEYLSAAVDANQMRAAPPVRAAPAIDSAATPASAPAAPAAASVPARAAGPEPARGAEAAAVAAETPSRIKPDATAAAAPRADKYGVPAASPAAEGKRRGLAPAPESAMNWRYRTMSMDGVLTALSLSVKRARGAKGDLRFIEEPDTAEALDKLDALFASLSESALYVDVGSMLRFGAADVTDFLRAYRQALARALKNESRRSLFRFGRLAERLGVRGLFGAYPLGALVYGEDGEEALAEKSDYAAIIEAITVFGRRRRPLMLVVRGGECLQPSLTEFFVRMVPVASVKPVCLFVFGEDFPAELKDAARKSAR